jgi:hypothetical protein
VVGLLLSLPAWRAIADLGYIGDTAGADPISRGDLHNTWYLGSATSGLRLRDAIAPRLEAQGFVCLDDVAGHCLDLFAFEHGF